MGVGTFSTVIVPRSAFEAARDPQQAHRLAQAVVQFVNMMTREGLYTRDELLPKATQAFHADFYLAQVNNGGHAQFIQNSHNNADFALADVQAALKAIQVEPYAAIVEQLVAFAAERRDPATGKIDVQRRKGEPDVLDEIDKQFYAADKAAPFRNLLGGWIASWPELRPVDDADYPEAMRLSITMNPLRAVRQLWRTVSMLTGQTTDRFLVAVGLACAHIQVPEIRIKMGVGVMAEVEGAQERAFVVHTNTARPRFCVVKAEHASAYEYIPPNVPDIPNMYTDPNVMIAALNDGRLKDVTGPRAGARLSRVNAALIDDVVALAKEHRAGLAVDLLLRQASIKAVDPAVAPMMVIPSPDGDMVRWIMHAGDRPWTVLTMAAGAALIPWASTEAVAKVSRRDLDEYAAGIAAGNMGAKPL
jgi:hypothetical protein